MNPTEYALHLVKTQRRQKWFLVTSFPAACTNTAAGNTTGGRVQAENTLYQNSGGGLSFPFFSVLITSRPSQSIACKVIVWLTFSLQPSSSQLPSTLPAPLCLSHARTFPPGGLTGKGYGGGTLRYNQGRWSNSLPSVYTHIQFVAMLEGASGEGVCLDGSLRLSVSVRVHVILAVMCSLA